jgi:hypothetical protein
MASHNMEISPTAFLAHGDTRSLSSLPSRITSNFRRERVEHEDVGIFPYTIHRRSYGHVGSYLYGK